MAPNCCEIEARDFEARATISRALYPVELPSGTAFERRLAMLVTPHEASGLDGIRAWLAADPDYRRVCGISSAPKCSVNDDGAGRAEARCRPIWSVIRR